ncbi:MAG: hypothetical protein ACK5NN_07045 [Sphingomonadaceae bacterium]
MKDDILEDRKLTFGQIMNGTIEMARDNFRLFAIYTVVLSVIGAASEWSAEMIPGMGGMDDYMVIFGAGAGFGGILYLIAMVIGQYVLWDRILAGSGLGPTMAHNRYFGFLGQGILIAIGTILGLMLLVVPGLIFMARWAMAPALLVGYNQGATEAMGNSWEATKGNTTPVVLGIVVGTLAIVALTGIIEAIGLVTTSLTPLTLFLGEVVSQTGSVLMIALGLYLHEQFFGSAAQLVDVFE